MWEIDDLSSINKLKSLIKNRFGKGLEISRLTDLNSVKPDSDFFFKKTDMVIPIYHEKTYLGTAIVKKASDIDSEQLFTLSSLVKMTLTPALFSHFQTLQENNLQVLEESIVDEVNDVSEEKTYDDFGISKLSISESATTFVTEEESSRKIVSQVIHLNGINEIVLKVAHQIHELEKRWGFVPLKDLNIQFENVEEIKKLGAMTIFVKDILDLSLAQQSVLVEYQKTISNAGSPLIVVGSNLKLETIANHPAITTDLLLALDSFTFEVNKAPMSYSKLKEVAEMLFYVDKG